MEILKAGKELGHSQLKRQNSFYMTKIDSQSRYFETPDMSGAFDLLILSKLTSQATSS